MDGDKKIELYIPRKWYERRRAAEDAARKRGSKGKRTEKYG